MNKPSCTRNDIANELRFFWSWLRFMLVRRFWRDKLPKFLELQKSHLFLYVPICFGMGIALYFSLRFEPPLERGLGVFFVGLIIFMIFYRWINNTLRLSFMALLFCLGGFIWSGLHTHWHSTVMLTKAMGPKMVEGTVQSLSLVEGHLTVATLKGVAIEGLEPHATPEKIKLRSYHIGEGIRLGDRVSVLAKLTPPSRPVIPDGFDFQRRSFFLGIGGTGFTLGDVSVIVPRENQVAGGFWERQALFFERLRFAINDRIESVQAPQFAGLSKALITGDRSAIKDEDYEALKSAGLAHLLAISGLHIGLVSGFVFVIIRFLLCLLPAIAIRYPIKKIAAVLAIASALFYMLLAGATIPTQRAALTTSIIFLAVILDRKAISLRLVAFAALVVLLIAPESLLSASFQLSFAAVLALISFYEWWQRRSYRRDVDPAQPDRVLLKDQRVFAAFRYSWWASPLFYIGGIMLTSLIATFATTIFAAYHFGYAHVYGLLGNVLALPIVSLFVMPMAVMSMVLWPFEWASQSLLSLMEQGLSLVMIFAHGIHEFPHSVLHVPQISTLSFLVFSAAFILLCILRGAGRFYISGGLLIILALFVLIDRDRVTHAYILEDSRSIAFMQDNQLIYIGDLPSSFVRGQVAEYFGIKADDFEQSDSLCDQRSCVLDVEDEKIVFVRDAAFYQQICQQSEAQNIRLIYSPTPIDYRLDCNQRDVISLDFFDLWRYGSYRLYYDYARKDLRVKSVEGLRGYRPWTTRDQRRSLKVSKNLTEGEN